MRISTVSLFLLIVLVGLPARGETPAESIEKKVLETIEIRQKTQKREDAWAGRKGELLNRYRSLEAEKEHLLRGKSRTDNLLNARRVRMAEIERKVKESVRIRDELQSYLESVVERLDAFIEQDLPFLPRERADRIASIKETLAGPDIQAAEKYRRVMEALQVETEYGRTIEVYQDTVELDSRSVLLDILRLGRLSLFCQTPDGRVVGHYDRAAERWVTISVRYRREINKAVDMARRERTIDLVRLPIGRIIVP